MIHRLLAKIFYFISYKRFVKSSKEPEAQFNKSWTRIQKNLSKGTFWYKKFTNFESLALSDFEITNYDFYKEQLDNDHKKLHSSFNGELMLTWSASSGSTAKEKQFPITKTYQKEFQAVSGPFVYQLVKNNPMFLKHSVLYLAASDRKDVTPAGTEIGYISRYNYKNIPAFFKPKYTLPDAVFQDPETFSTWAPLYALSKSIDTIMAVTPLSIDSFIQKIIFNKDFYIKNIKNPQIPEGLPKIKFTNSRKNYLLNIMSQKNITLKELWPELTQIICWKSSSCRLQISHLKKLFSGLNILDAMYSATEGWVNVPFGDGNVGGPLQLNGHIFEFIEENKTITADQLKKPWQLEIGKLYEVFITNSMGLIRYRIKDVVLCTGFLHRNPIIEFSHKAEGILTLGLAKITSEQLVNNVESLRSPLSLPWAFAPSSSGDYLILYTKEPVSNEHLVELDILLKNVNETYANYRNRDDLKPIKNELISNKNPISRGLNNPQAKYKFLYNTPIEN